MSFAHRAGVDLDDAVAVEAADPSQMLRAVASSASQVREAAALFAEADLSRLTDDGRPRAVVTLGMGGSGVAGDVLSGVAGAACAAPIVVHKDYGLPGWVGAADLVVAVSCSGSTEETLSGTDEAIRRGARLVCVGGVGSPLAARAEQARAPFITVPGGRQPRASIWALSLPALLVAQELGLLTEPVEVEATAARLEDVAFRCAPTRDSLVNPAKDLALRLAGRLISIWGCSPLAGVAAYRAACQFNENAKSPATWGVLPEADHNQVVGYDGPFAAGERDIFADDELDGPDPVSLHQILLRDPAGEHERVSRRADIGADLASARGVAVTSLGSEGATRLERLASLVALVDYASVYLAILSGLDPTPVNAIGLLKDRLAQPLA